MRSNGKIDYLELQAADGVIDTVKAFYSAAFSWTFTDYGPQYSAFQEGLDGGFDGSSTRQTKPLPVIYSDNLEATLNMVKESGGKIVQPIFSFPGGRRFHFTDPAGNELAVWSE